MEMNFMRMYAAMKMEARELTSLFNFKLESSEIYGEKRGQLERMVQRKYLQMEFP